MKGQGREGARSEGGNWERGEERAQECVFFPLPFFLLHPLSLPFSPPLPRTEGRGQVPPPEPVAVSAKAARRSSMRAAERSSGAGRGGPGSPLGGLGPLDVEEPVPCRERNLDEPDRPPRVVVAAQAGPSGLQGRGVRVAAGGAGGRGQGEPRLPRGLEQRSSTAAAAPVLARSLAAAVVALDTLRPRGPPERRSEPALYVPCGLGIRGGLGLLARARRRARAARAAGAKRVPQRCLRRGELVGCSQGLRIRGRARGRERGLSPVSRGAQEERRSVDSLFFLVLERETALKEGRKGSSETARLLPILVPILNA